MSAPVPSVNGTAVDVVGASKRFGDVAALDNLSISVAAGVTYGIVGPSGCGKTSLIRAIVGLLTLDEGWASVYGTRMPSLEAARNIGYMTQTTALYRQLSVRDNIAFYARMYPNIPESAVDRTLDLVELGDWRNARIGQLSGGMQRRVALAIALVHGPRLLMLDEPTVGQDPRLRVKFWDEFRRLNRNGVTVVASTHSMDEAERCDELALIDAGRVIAHGSPEELKMSQKVNTLEEAFLNLTEARR